MPRAMRMRLGLVAGQVVAQARHPGVHARAAQLLLVGLLADGHLDQRRPAEEDAGPVLDHDGVVAHARQVGAAGGRGAEHDADRSGCPAPRAGSGGGTARRRARRRRPGAAGRPLRTRPGSAPGGGSPPPRPWRAGACGSWSGSSSRRARSGRWRSPGTGCAPPRPAPRRHRRPPGRRCAARPAGTARARACRGRPEPRGARAPSSCRGPGGARRTAARRRPAPASCSARTSSASARMAAALSANSSPADGRGAMRIGVLTASCPRRAGASGGTPPSPPPPRRRRRARPTSRPRPPARRPSPAAGSARSSSLVARTAPGADLRSASVCTVDPGVERRLVVDHRGEESGRRRLRRAEALAGERGAGEEAPLDHAQRRDQDHGRRHADPDLGEGERARLRRHRQVGRRDEAEAAGPRVRR